MKGKKKVKEPAGMNIPEIFAALAMLEKERGIPQTFMMDKIIQDALVPYSTLIIILVLAVICKVLLDLYLNTKSGFLLRAVGDNDVLVVSLAKDKGNIKILGLAISNGLVALAGCVFAQEERVFEISMGTGAMVIGLASVIIGTSIFRKLTLLRTTTAVQSFIKPVWQLHSVILIRRQ